MSWEVGRLLVSGVSEAGVEARSSQLGSVLSRREPSQPSTTLQSDAEKPKIRDKTKFDVSPILDQVHCWPLEKLKAL